MKNSFIPDKAADLNSGKLAPYRFAKLGVVVAAHVAGTCLVHGHLARNPNIPVLSAAFYACP
jgi:hypothetical protein